MGKWYLVNQVKRYLGRLIELEINSKCYSAEQTVGEMMLEFDFHGSLWMSTLKMGCHALLFDCIVRKWMVLAGLNNPCGSGKLQESLT